MNNVTISKEAINLISEKCNDSVITSKKAEDSVLLLSWPSRVTRVDHSGNRTELGPGFYFSWSDPKQIEEYGYLTVKLDGGDELALAPGKFFRSGSHNRSERWSPHARQFGLD
jgi:hypothetical protein